MAAHLKEDDQELAGAAKETVLALRKVRRTIERRFPAAAGGGTVAGAKPTRVAGGGGGGAEAKPAAAVGGPAHTALAQADPAWAEARVAAALAQAGTPAGMVSGRPLTDPPGLKRIQRLRHVRAAVEQAARKKGLHTPAGH